VFDYDFLKPGDRKEREYLNSLTLEGLIELANDLNLSIENIDLNNKRRVIRLIESKGKIPTKGNLRKHTLLIGVKLNSKDHIKAIENRVNNMIINGLENEVRGLNSKYSWESEALKGVGYKQWKRYFEGTQTLEETRQQIIFATKNLSKKQRTWFKRNKSIQWFDQPVSIDMIVELITTKLSI
jgi:tRNA dimethylallyltransferase